jgi:hypothetical protein
MNSIDFQIADNLCVKILEKFNVFSELEGMKAWLNEYKTLYDKFNIQPKGLPAIARCNFDGVKYDNIAKFHRLYHKIEYENNLLNHMSHEEIIKFLT